LISLKDVNKHNWEACTQLKVSEQQKDSIAPNLYSIAEAQFLPGLVTKAIYSYDTLVGFVMYGLDSDDHNYWIYRFMIDELYQGRGFGQQGMQLVIEDIAARADRTEVIRIGYKPTNESARRLYAKVGFVETGIAEWGEMIAAYRFETVAKPFPTLETNRLMLRQLRSRDAADVFSYFARDEVTKYYDLASFTEQRQAEELIRQWNDRFIRSEGMRWGITLKGEDRIIGTCGFHNWSKEHSKSELGYELAPEY
jgi:diamine N-acetyltransferase